MGNFVLLDRRTATRALFVALGAWLGLAGCKPRTGSQVLADAPTRGVETQPGDQTLVNMLYGTSRRGDEQKLLRKSYDDMATAYGRDRVFASSGPSDRQDYNNYGLLSVNVPRRHTEGRVETRYGYAWNDAFDPGAHFGIVRLYKYEKGAFAEVLKQAQTTNKPRVLVFVHGFNVTFERAATSFAQFVYDTRYDGVPVLYSWASQGEVASYTNDEETVRFSEPLFRDFLDHIVATVPDAEITILAHSMGNRLLLGTLDRLVERRRGPEDKPLFGHVVLAAPDVDSAEFKNAFSAAYPLAGRWSLYANEKDVALEASIVAHYGSRRAQGLHAASRAGQGGERLLVLEGLESVDMSELDGDLLSHATFAVNPRALQDMRENIVFGKPAAERSGLKRATKDFLGRPYPVWILSERAE